MKTGGSKSFLNIILHRNGSVVNLPTSPTSRRGSRASSAQRAKRGAPPAREFCIISPGAGAISFSPSKPRNEGQMQSAPSEIRGPAAERVFTLVRARLPARKRRRRSAGRPNNADALARPNRRPAISPGVPYRSRASLSRDLPLAGARRRKPARCTCRARAAAFAFAFFAALESGASLHAKVRPQRPVRYARRSPISGCFGSRGWVLTLFGAAKRPVD